MVRFNGWYIFCSSSGLKVPSEMMGANQGVSVSSSVGLAWGRLRLWEPSCLEA